VTKQKQSQHERRNEAMSADAPIQSATKLLLIRHAPSQTGGCVAGRRDVAADCTDTVAFAALRGAVGQVGHTLVSPALRCLQTAATLWADLGPKQDARIWEQDFGAWEGVPYSDLPNLGSLSICELANHRPPDGESFLDLYARTKPALLDMIGLGGRVAVVAHAGLIRAALGMALNAPARGLVFQIAPLSLTTITALPDGAFSIDSVNQTWG
jgi:alpha-ribazole phosphatase